MHACERGDQEKTLGDVWFAIGTDIESASGNTIWHSIFVPLMEPWECKYLGEYSLPHENKGMHVKEGIKMNLLMVLDL